MAFLLLSESIQQQQNDDGKANESTELLLGDSTQFRSLSLLQLLQQHALLGQFGRAVLKARPTVGWLLLFSLL
jgi:hypothetical protein